MSEQNSETKIINDASANTGEREFFIRAESFAAPFCSDSSSAYQRGRNVGAALLAFKAKYSHPRGLYAALAYASADAYHKGEKPLAKWLCNHEQARMRATDKLGSYSYLGHAPGHFEINHKHIRVDDPKGGSIVAV